MGRNGLIRLIFEYEFEVLQEVRGLAVGWLWGSCEGYPSGVVSGFNIGCLVCTL